MEIQYSNEEIFRFLCSRLVCGNIVDNTFCVSDKCIVSFIILCVLLLLELVHRKKVRLVTWLGLFRGKKYKFMLFFFSKMVACLYQWIKIWRHFMSSAVEARSVIKHGVACMSREFTTADCHQDNKVNT